MRRTVHVHLHRTGDEYGEAEAADPVPAPPLPSRRPVYSSMALSERSAAALSAWARSIGVLYAEPRPHVTVAYTRRPVDVPASYRTADSAAGLVVPPGGRRVARFGASLVLLLRCPELLERFGAWRARGASWDYPDYQPHVTFCDLKHNGGATIDLTGPAFDEPLHLMPEVVSAPREAY